MAAAKAAISTATGYRIETDPRLHAPLRLPSQRTVRGRRRPDPLAGIFEQEYLRLLQREPHLRAVTIFEELLRRHPELSHRGRRTLGTARAPPARPARSRTGGVIFAQRQPPGRMGLSG